MSRKLHPDKRDTECQTIDSGMQEIYRLRDDMQRYAYDHRSVIRDCD